MAEDRLNYLLSISSKTGATLDVLYLLTSDLDIQALRKASGKVSALPKYKKSKESPYLSQISRAPFRESLEEPTSQLE